MSCPLNNWVHDFSGVFSKDEIFYIHQTSLLTRESQTKNDLKFYPIIVKMSIINKKMTIKPGGILWKEESLFTTIKNKNVVAIEIIIKGS